MNIAQFSPLIQTFDFFHQHFMRLCKVMPVIFYDICYIFLDAVLITGEKNKTKTNKQRRKTEVTILLLSYILLLYFIGNFKNF